MFSLFTLGMIVPTRMLLRCGILLSFRRIYVFHGQNSFYGSIFRFFDFKAHNLLSCRRINAFSWTKFILWLNFQVLRDDKRGFGILVSSVPKDSHALYSLIDPSEVGS